MGISKEEISLLEQTARRLGAQVEASGVEEDPERAMAFFERAWELGMAADPDPAAPGFMTGVWGRAAVEESLRPSLRILSILGEFSAGFAAMVHAQGLACLALGGAPVFPIRTRLAVGWLSEYGISIGEGGRSAGAGIRLRNSSGVLRLEGTVRFLIASGPPQGYVLFAGLDDRSGEGGWALILLDATTTGVRIELLPERLGLRSLWMAHLYGETVHLAPDRILLRGPEADQRLRQVLAIDYLGQAAMALGIARRSLREAYVYARQRYQGGRWIIDHPAVRLLLGTAAFDCAALEAVLERHADVPLKAVGDAALLRWAAVAKLAIGEHAYRAVTNSMQVLGGYGYMEDYPLARRLRDVATLRTLHGAPDLIRMVLAGLEKEKGIGGSGG